MKQNNTIKHVGLILLKFISFYATYWLLNTAFILMIHRFYPLDSLSFISIIFLLPLVYTTFSMLCVEVKVIKNKLSNFLSFLKSNGFKILVFYIILCTCFVSISEKLYMTEINMESSMQIQWMMFGISAGLFICWNGLFNKMLKTTKNINLEQKTGFERYLEIKRVRNNLLDLNRFMGTLILISFNLAFLIIASGMVYNSSHKALLISQIFVSISFFITTNTIFAVFSDIIMPLISEKFNLSIEYKKTASQWDEEEKAAIYDGIKKIVDQNMTLDDEEDLQLSKDEFASTLTEVIHSYFK